MGVTAPPAVTAKGFLTGVGPEVHLQAGLPFEFLLAHLTLMHGGFIPANESLVNQGRRLKTELKQEEADDSYFCQTFSPK